MKFDCLISIIIPVYKVEAYLRKCLDSVVQQDLTECEIIVVDDGSPDACPAICDEYAQRFDTIRVIHKPNGGLSSARNAGIAQAKGKYIMLIDSDDYLEPDVLTSIKKLLYENEADVTVLRAKTVDDAGTIRDKVNYTIPKGNYTVNAYLSMLKAHPESVTFCAQFSIYRHEFLLENDLHFLEGIIHEDELWTVQVLLKAQTICYSDLFFYYHYIRSGSIMHSSNGEKSARSLFIVCEQCAALFTEQKESDIGYLKDRMVYLFLQAICKISDHRPYVQKFGRKFPIKNALYSKTKLKAIVFWISPVLYRKIFDQIRK